MHPQVGQVINNKYRLLRLVGDGGMGSVYEARHEVLGTSVALKFLHAELGRRPGLVQRFLQEARVSARIQSPHVVRVTDVDQTANGAFMVMEFIEGKTLQALYEELYKAGRQLAYADALEYALQMLEGVEAAHAEGIVHRDLKPDNVMITFDPPTRSGRPRIVLLDFGIAKLKLGGQDDRGLTRPGVIMGTPEYMAPEQAFSADAVDARADIFSLGVIIFEMLAGRRPVGGEDPHQIAGAYLSGQISRLTDLAPGIAPELAGAVHLAMAALAKDRWATVTELREAMEPFASSRWSAVSLTPSARLSRVSLGPAETNGGTPSGRVSGFGADPSGSHSFVVRPVPKTLPPDDDGIAPIPEPRPRRADTTSPADPPSMTNPPMRGPTPLGGFAAFGEVEPEPAQAFNVGRGSASAVPFIPPTRSVVPLGAAGRDPAATGPASPVVASPSFFVSAPRAGGTAIPLDHSGLPGMVGPGSRRSQVAPVPGVSPLTVSAASRVAPQRRRGAFSSLPVILLLAAGVSAAVVGGVYLAHDHAKIDDHEDPPVAAVPAAPAPTTAPAEPPPPADDPLPTDAPVPSHPSRPSMPYKPGAPKGSAGPVAPPAPSNPPQRVPIIPSILIIPSNLPFDLPLFPPSRPSQADPPRGQDPSSPRERPAPGERPQRRPRPPPPGPPDGPPNEP